MVHTHILIKHEGEWKLVWIADENEERFLQAIDHDRDEYCALKEFTSDELDELVESLDGMVLHFSHVIEF